MTIFKHAVLLTLTLIGCGRDLEHASQINDLPEYDPAVYEQREKFRAGEKFTRHSATSSGNIQFLNFDTVRDCTLLSAVPKTYGGSDIKATFKKHKGDAILMTVPGSVNDANETFYITEEGLIANRLLDGGVIQQTTEFRLSSSNRRGIIGEVSQKFDVRKLRNVEFRNQGLAAYAENLQTGVRSESDHSRFVVRYIYCGDIQGHGLGAPGLAGACKQGTDDNVMNSEEGGCYSFQHRIVFGSKALVKMPFSVPQNDLPSASLQRLEADVEPIVKAQPVLSAEKYCKSLEENGYDDWELPTRKNLEEFSGPIATKYFSFELSEIDNGLETPLDFWSSYTGKQDDVWTVALQKTGVRKFTSKSNSASVVCVRKPQDLDNDGVPDSADACLGSKNENVRLIGDLRGCSVSTENGSNSVGGGAVDEK